MKKNRHLTDKILRGGITVISTIGMIVLIAVFVYVFKTGSSLLSWDLLTGDYNSKIYDGRYTEVVTGNQFTKPGNLGSDVYFSKKWGIGLKDDYDKEGSAYILVAYVASDSPLTSIEDKNNPDQTISIASGETLGKVIFSNNTIIYSSKGAQIAAQQFDQATGIKDILTSTSGKGIRGSIVTTFYLIVMTLVFAIPFGVSVAVYLHEYANKNSKIVDIFRRLIEMLTGVPSIIFGLMGAAVFIPIVSKITGSNGGNLITGALTLAVIVLPVIITSTEETLRTIPDEYRQASLALGATKTQTTIKVILKSAIPGILSATLLSIGRIIGESAALIYAVGTAIKDHIIITERSTSLAVHIWTIMSGESPNYALACAISIIILAVVLVMNLSVKLLAKKISY